MSEFSRTFVRDLFSAAAVVALVAVFPVAADAATKKKAKEARSAQSSVTAVSQYNMQRITAPVRRGQFGDEVRLPGGTWISCRQDCAGTLRDQTLDWWERNESRDHQND